MDDDDIRELMLDYEIDHATAERALELIEQGFDEDEAIDFAGSA
jgi:hypothetical protein